MKKLVKKSGRIDRSETFDEFLSSDGLLAEAEDTAIKRVIVDQIKLSAAEQSLTKAKMAARIKTSPRQLDRLFDSNNPAVTFTMLRRAARAVGRTLRVELDNPIIS